MKEWFKNFLSAIAGAVIVGTAVWFLKPCNEKLVIELPKRVIRDTMTIHDTTTVIKWKTHITIADTLTAVHRVVGGEKMDSMSVHLSSSSRPEYGLDSVTADYLYPPGWRQFVFWPADSLDGKGVEQKSIVPALFSMEQEPWLSIGVTPVYRLRDSKIQMESDIALRVRRATFRFGYMVSEQAPSWFVGVRVQRRLF